MTKVSTLIRQMAKEGHKLQSLERASVLAASDDPKDQDKAREIKTRFDYESLKRQIGSKKKPDKPAVNETTMPNVSSNDKKAIKSRAKNLFKRDLKGEHDGVNESVGGGVPMTPQELEIQKKMSRLSMRLARKRNQNIQKAKIKDTETDPAQPKDEVKEASAVLDANKKLEKEKKTKKDKAELAKLTHIYKGMKKGIYNSYEPEGESIGERTLSSYIPSDRQGEARRANLDYMKAQLKKKEDESTKNRGDLSKRDAGKMAKERLRTKKISSLGEGSAVLDANKKISDNEKREKMKKELIRLMKHAKDKRADINRESVEHVDESKGHKYDDSFIEGETGSKTSRRNLTRAMSSTKIGMGKGEKGKAEDSAKRRERHQADRGVKTRGTKAGHSGSAYPKMSKTLDDTYPHKKTARLQRKLADRKAGRKHVDDTHHSLKQKTVGEKLPRAKVSEDKAFDFVRNKLKSKYGDGVLTTGEKMKPPTAAQKEANRKHREKIAKQQAAEFKKDPSQGRYPSGYSNVGSD